MTDEDDLQYEELVAPISPDRPCGVDLRNDDTLLQEYLAIKDMRNELRREERRNIELDNNLVINANSWQPLVKKTRNILITHSKDIEVAVWLLEGLTRTEQFAGLNVGLKVLSEFFNQYPDQLHPAYKPDPEDEDTNPQVTPIAMLGGKYEAGTIIAPIYFCSLIVNSSGDGYNGWELKKILKSKNKNQGHNEVNKDDLLQADEIKIVIDDLDQEHFVKLKEDITNSIESFKQLNAILTKIFERNAPNLANLQESLNYCFGVVNAVAKIIYKEVDSALEKSENTAVNIKGEVSLDFIKTLDHTKLDKQSALALLEVVIMFFAETEPHSPISYSLARASKWARSSLPTILSDLLSEDARSQYCRITGTPFLDNHANSENYYEED